MEKQNGSRATARESTFVGWSFGSVCTSVVRRLSPSSPPRSRSRSRSCSLLYLLPLSVRFPPRTHNTRLREEKAAAALCHIDFTGLTYTRVRAVHRRNVSYHRLSLSLSVSPSPPHLASLLVTRDPSLSPVRSFVRSFVESVVIGGAEGRM